MAPAIRVASVVPGSSAAGSCSVAFAHLLRAPCRLPIASAIGLSGGASLSPVQGSCSLLPGRPGVVCVMVHDID